MENYRGLSAFYLSQGGIRWGHANPQEKLSSKPKFPIYSQQGGGGTPSSTKPAHNPRNEDARYLCKSKIR